MLYTLSTDRHELRELCYHTVDGDTATASSDFLVGDSLTERGSDPDSAGWVSLMLHRYNRSTDIVPRGLSGYNTKWFIEFALPSIEQELSESVRSPNLITLWLGTNDAALPDGDVVKQHVPLAEYTANLTKIVRAFQLNAPSAKILLITPPHVDDTVRQSRSSTNQAERTNAVAGEYARACADVARELELNVLDMYSYFNALPESDRNACLNDGLHFAVKTFVGGPTQIRPVLFLVGDSLTENGVDPDKAGWAALLRNHFRRSADILPRGLSGYNTK
ncbi:hypothetical protein BBJ29_005657 [Phytophthora kernoviae]|uniref:SGNH hydrolase-type esterase domain-containing protein n=1 Tax=Phytophthora kernoviae TaxID=325452 RepID=A0A3F2RT02_9STRA|nr:hypothetical protein BBP00_00003940 [Phytophthora kernoviae]RLN64681.1 hypothetical protein BBJ29_005657 [Phytophthora kernoviae]